MPTALEVYILELLNFLLTFRCLAPALICAARGSAAILRPFSPLSPTEEWILNFMKYIKPKKHLNPCQVCENMVKTICLCQNGSWHKN